MQPFRCRLHPPVYWWNGQIAELRMREYDIRRITVNYSSDHPLIYNTEMGSRTRDIILYHMCLLQTLEFLVYHPFWEHYSQRGPGIP
ncbi:hypothetical protein J6590_053328 [Homalodisca vitripennis]|nr:hypothetical protein J6590_053328 [Homalodisca vitripennis]